MFHVTTLSARSADFNAFIVNTNQPRREKYTCEMGQFTACRPPTTTTKLFKVNFNCSSSRYAPGNESLRCFDFFLCRSVWVSLLNRASKKCRRHDFPHRNQTVMKWQYLGGGHYEKNINERMESDQDALTECSSGHSSANQLTANQQS